MPNNSQDTPHVNPKNTNSSALINSPSTTACGCCALPRHSTKGKSVQHVLKVWNEFYELIASGDIHASLRKDDRPYATGDTLLLREYDPKLNIYTGHTVTQKITHTLRDFPGLQPGYVLLSVIMPYVDSIRFDVSLAGKTAEEISRRDGRQ